MAIPPEAKGIDDPLNTVAVVPFDLPPATSSSSRSGAGASSANSLAAAASNLINAIAQGSAPVSTSASVPPRTALEDDGSDDGSSSFTYTAPAQSNSAEQGRWYASTPYHISNRYYDADITLAATRYALSPSSAPLSSSFPAYLVVVDASRPLVHHKRLAAALESRVAAGFDADISIVAGVPLLASDSQMVIALDDEKPSQREGQREERAKTSDLVAVYADAGWEYISIDDADEEESLGGSDSEEGDREDDKDGIERIREALMNHMWQGLVRKDYQTNRASTRDVGSSEPAPGAWGQGFSEAIGASHGENDDDEDDPRDGLAEIGRTSDKELGGPLSALPSATPAEATKLDEQLAALFLSSSNPSNLTDLEAFLESEDPSWPAPTVPPPAGSNQFEDDFDDFLPFQSGPAATSTTSASADDVDLPDMDEISEMQGRLFGSNAASRLEAGVLGMGSGGGEAGQDLAGQLQQLQWHAERVRSIEDPEKKRKEAALVALAFSMQWGSEGEDMSF